MPFVILRERKVYIWIIEYVCSEFAEDSDKTHQEIATILETSQTMYARYERGANEMPIRHLIRLAQYYNVSTDYFLGLTKEKTPFPKK